MHAEVDHASVEAGSNHDVEDAPTNRLGQLTTHVIESSSTFYSILRHILPHASFDIAATMLILTTYICLAQLHHTLYAHV